MLAEIYFKMKFNWSPWRNSSSCHQKSIYLWGFCSFPRKGERLRRESPRTTGCCCWLTGCWEGNQPREQTTPVVSSYLSPLSLQTKQAVDNQNTFKSSSIFVHFVTNSFTLILTKTNWYRDQYTCGLLLVYTGVRKNYQSYINKSNRNVVNLNQKICGKKTVRKGQYVWTSMKSLSKMNVINFFPLILDPCYLSNKTNPYYLTLLKKKKNILIWASGNFNWSRALVEITELVKYSLNQIDFSHWWKR